MKPKIAVLASGEGTNFEAIAQAAHDGQLRADIVGLITNRGTAGALARAERLKIPSEVVSLKLFSTREAWDQAMVDQLKAWNAEWVVLAGFLALIGPKMLAGFPHRIVNSHPALLPKFGGTGMYGDNVHAAVLRAGERETGVTIHTIDAEYDRGKILAQERVKVLEGDTPATLSARVKAAEVALYPRVLNDLVTGQKTTS